MEDLYKEIFEKDREISREDLSKLFKNVLANTDEFDTPKGDRVPMMALLNEKTMIALDKAVEILIKRGVVEFTTTKDGKIKPIPPTRQDILNIGAQLFCYLIDYNIEE